MSDQTTFRRGDVVWAPDPFRSGSNPRLWLILAADILPFAGQEYICAALTTSNFDANYRVGDAWISGSNPAVDSFCSPWVLATIKHDSIVNPQGQVTTKFTNRVSSASCRYLSESSRD